MEPVEVNAGAWYLRAVRADDRLSDIPALTDLGLPDPHGYIESVIADWSTTEPSPETASIDESDRPATPRCVWAICEPTTGELVGLIGITGARPRPRLTGAARSGFHDALAAASGPVSRFATGALGWPEPTELLPGIP